MDNRELMQHWLWMQTMEYALHMLKHECKNHLFPQTRYSEWKNLGWEEMQRVIFTHILERLGTHDFRGNYSGGSRFEVGHDMQMDSTGVVGKYKDMTVLITWPEVRKFIKTMLAGEPDKQLDLFELLTREAKK